MKRKLPASLATLLLTACSANSLAPMQQDQVKVDSVPVGASVLVLGEAMGQTPLHLNTRDIFPQSYDHDKQHLYGRIVLSYPGCEPFTTTVSSRIISEGLNARLKCNTPREDGDQATPLPTTPTAVTESEQESDRLKQRLRQAKELFDEGLINVEEYAEKRRQLLEEL